MIQHVTDECRIGTNISTLSKSERVLQHLHLESLVRVSGPQDLDVETTYG